MPERMSPAYRTGMIHGAYDAARPARYRLGFHATLIGWQYRRGFARAFRAARGLPPLQRPHQPAGRCWCRAYHGTAAAATTNGGPRVRTETQAPAAGTQTGAAAPETALERARRAARR